MFDASPEPRAHAEDPQDPPELKLAEVPLRETVELVRIDLPDHQVEPLFERGMLPGCAICPVRRSPSGDPIVRIGGSILALRREMAGCICVRRPVPAPAV